MRRDFPSFKATACALGMLLVPSVQLAAADTVFLRTGEVLHGRVLRASEEEVSIQLDSGGILSFRAGRVDKVRQYKPGASTADVIVYNQKGPIEEGRPPTPSGAPPTNGNLLGGTRERSGTESGPGTPRGGEAKPSASEISSFPLHSQKLAVGATEAGDGRRVALERFRDAASGYSVVPPLGFVPWTDDTRPRQVLRAFKEPTTHANFTITAHDSSEGLDQIKTQLVNLIRGKAQVLKESRCEIPGPAGGFPGWLIEMEHSLEQTKVRQLQLIVKSGKRTFFVTCSAAENHYGDLSIPFEDSLGSFRIDTGDGTPASAVDPENLPTDLQSYLRKNHEAADRPKSMSDIDLRLYIPKTGQLIDRVDERMRGSGNRGYTITP